MRYLKLRNKIKAAKKRRAANAKRKAKREGVLMKARKERIMKTAVKAIFAFLIVAVSIFLLLIEDASAINYKVTGVNLVTGERVLGEMQDDFQNGSVIGQIMDKNLKLEVVGVWSGVGKAILVREHPVSAYEIDVVEDGKMKGEKK